jgi:osmotically-inducible protein OsmY
MASRTKPLIFGSVLSAALALSAPVLAQSAAQWGKAIVDTGKEAVHTTERAFYKAAEDPILIERTKSALTHDLMTMNQPIVVSANNGVIILEGEVARPVALRAVQVASQVAGARGVDDRLLYEGALTERRFHEVYPG